MSARKLKSRVAHAAVAVIESLSPRRLLAAADLDLSFGNGGIARDEVVRSVELESVKTLTDSIGRVVVAGTIRGTATSSSDLFIQRFNADGSIDSSFGSGGITIVDLGGDERLASISAAGEKLLLSATHLSRNVQNRIAVVRLTAGGALDSGFDGDGSLLFTFGSRTFATSIGARILGDGRIVVAGTVLKNGIAIGHALARLRSNGSFDPDFSGDGLTEITLSGERRFLHSDLHVRQDDSILLAGALLVRRPGDERIVLGALQLAPDGILDSNFGAGGVFQSSESISHVFVDGDSRFSAPTLLNKDGALLLAGSLQRANETATPHIVRVIKLDTIGRADASFGVGGETIFPRAEQTSVDGIAANTDGVYLQLSAETDEIVRLDSTGQIDPDFGDSGAASLPDSGGVLTPGAIFTDALGRIVTGGQVEYSLGEINFAAPIASRFTSDGALDPSFGGAGFATAAVAGRVGKFHRAIELPDGKILAAGFTLGTGLDFLLRKFNTDGSIDTTFGNAGSALVDFGGSEQAMALAVQSDGRILVGGGGKFGEFTDFVLARLLPDGRLDSGFSGDGKVRATAGGSTREEFIGIFPQSNGTIIVGGPSNTNSVVMRYRSNGSLDSSFGVGGVVKIVPEAGTKFLRAAGLGVNNDGTIIVAADARKVRGNVGFASLLRLNSGGQLDRTFDSDGRLDIGVSERGAFETLRTFALQPDGKMLLLIASGYFDSAPTLLRRNADGSPDETFAAEIVHPRFKDAADLNTIALSPRGSIVLAGDLSIARLNPLGSTDAYFNDGVRTQLKIESLRLGTPLATSGRILIPGSINGGPAILALQGDTATVPFASVQQNQLVVEGTKSADLISVKREGENWTVAVNGMAQRFARSEIQSVMIAAGRGNDRISISDVDVETQLIGGPGDDLISVGANSAGVVIEGGSGFDTLTGGGGDDTLIGGNDGDRLDGGAGSDILSGGAGFDAADYGNRSRGVTVDNDDVADDGQSGEADNVQSNIERIYGGRGNDRLTLIGDRLATLIGGTGNDTLRAGGGATHLLGEGGDDRLIGGPADDFLDGGSGRNTLAGGDGNDRLSADTGADDFSGGGGDDSVSYQGLYVQIPDRTESGYVDYGISERLARVLERPWRTTNLRISIDQSADDGAAGENDFVREDIERLFTGFGDDYISGSTANNYLEAGNGDNTIFGNDGNDTLIGGIGDDWIDGGNGADKITGGGGYAGLSAISGVRNQRGNDRLFGGAGNDFFDEYDYNNDTIDGGAGRDVARRDRDNFGATDKLLNVERFFGISRYPDPLQ